ncbi:hypothetical protein QJS10_CPA07g00121 [Acorus calamus]|uniref:Uncharacterized protein n=1 Tax=Acorus calamus TaxID=4465 RepID=A0AAV9EFK6_ACOCL|nr:hypothetical protein QJS10_CPA07g00121 [Acorus calamus]
MADLLSETGPFSSARVEVSSALVAPEGGTFIGNGGTLIGVGGIRIANIREGTPVTPVGEGGTPVTSVGDRGNSIGNSRESSPFTGQIVGNVPDFGPLKIWEIVEDTRRLNYSHDPLKFPKVSWEAVAPDQNWKLKLLLDFYCFELLEQIILLDSREKEVVA